VNLLHGLPPQFHRPYYCDIKKEIKGTLGVLGTYLYDTKFWWKKIIVILTQLEIGETILVNFFILRSVYSVSLNWISLF